MIAKSMGEYTQVPTDFVPLLWTRLVSHANITLSNIALSEGETLVSVYGAYEPDVFSEDGGGAHGDYRVLWHKVMCFC